MFFEWSGVLYHVLFPFVVCLGEEDAAVYRIT